jgi:glycosyltransferase involved in cell wall biosynthesis
MELTQDVSIGFVGTYPPTVCGIASYTASLVDAIVDDGTAGNRIGVVSLTDGSGDGTGLPWVFSHRIGDRGSLRIATRLLDTHDIVSIQHEFGIFGGRDGEEVIDLLSGLSVPTALTLHTVLKNPTHHQRWIVDRICDLAERVIVMSETASDRLIGRYGVDPDRVSVIPHGVAPEFAGPPLTGGDRPLILTWGLIGPGKGLEWAIQGLAELKDVDPLPRYLILGATHPQVRRESGESYRDSLVALAAGLGLQGMVEFDDRYLDRKTLAEFVRGADVILLPYESEEQVTSGVLVEAIAAFKPVLATPFPHAVELLPSGAGVVVPYAAPTEIGDALRRMLGDPSLMASMTQRARGLAADWYWPAVGRRFAGLMAEMVEVSQLDRISSRDRRRVVG